MSNLLSMACESAPELLGPWQGLPIAHYGLLSDYGRSYLRPLVALFYSAPIGTLAFLPAGSLSPGQSLGLSTVVCRDEDSKQLIAAAKRLVERFEWHDTPRHGS